MYINTKQIVSDETDSDEEILWEGQPIPKLFTGSSVITFIFGIIFTAFSILWVGIAMIISSIPFSIETLFVSVFPLFGLPFIVVGIVLILSPYLTYRRTKRIVYAITNKRCIIITAGRSKKVKSYGYDTIQNVDKTEYSNGSGDLVFAKEQYMTSVNNNRRLRIKDIGFLRIHKVREVEKLLKAAMTKDNVS